MAVHRYRSNGGAIPCVSRSIHALVHSACRSTRSNTLYGAAPAPDTDADAEGAPAVAAAEADAAAAAGAGIGVVTPLPAAAPAPAPALGARAVSAFSTTALMRSATACRCDGCSSALMGERSKSAYANADSTLCTAHTRTHTRSHDTTHERDAGG